MAWTYEQKFNSLSTADLNSQDSWSGDTDFDVITGTVFEGTKAVHAVNANGIVARAITGVSSGVFYIAMMRPDTAGDAEFNLRTSTNGADWCRIIMESSNIELWYSDGAGGATFSNLLAGYVANQWYLFRVTINSTSSFKVEYSLDGITYTDSLGNKTSITTGNVDTIRLGCGGTGNGYWDLITPTNPFPASAPTTSLVSYWPLDSASTALVDSYSESNSDSSAVGFTATVTGLGQSFTTVGSAQLSTAVFYMKKTGTPTGNANAKIYAMTGVQNSTAKPTGAALATSDNFDVSTLTGSLALVTFTFSGAEQITLSAATDYVVVVEYGSATSSNHPDFGLDLISPADSTGNASRLLSGTWSSQSYDICFYVYAVATIPDSVASNHLTNVNSAPFVTGKISNGVDLELGSLQSLTITDAAQSGLDITGSISISAWWKPESSSTFQWIVSKYLIAGNLRAYGLYFDSNTLNFVASTDGTATVTASKSFTPSNGTWYHLVATCDVSSGATVLYVNGLSLGSTGSFPGSIFNSSAQFAIGTGDAGTANVDGVVDEVGIWSRVLTPLEITLLYNGGTGLTYPFVIIQNLTLTVDTADYVLTLNDIATSYGRTLAVDVVNYTLTLFDALLSFKGWLFENKHSSNYGNQSKHTSNYGNTGKHTSNWNFEDKN